MCFSPRSVSRFRLTTTLISSNIWIKLPRQIYLMPKLHTALPKQTIILLLDKHLTCSKG